MWKSVDVVKETWMTISKEKTKELINEFGKNAEDSGTTESQISIFSERIKNLTEHLKINKKDKSAQRGLMLLVSKRSRLLKYLKKTRLDDYKQIVERIGIRK